MFRLHKSRHSPVKSEEKFHFKFSQFEALEVPKGWDRLFVSIISVESGKAVAKTSKAAVKNGNCQWTDSVSDSIWIPKENHSHSSKELEYCPYKFVLSMGSTRSGILGEVVMNMAAYMSSSDSFLVSFPLNKCRHGTILQLKIQCLTPRISLRDYGSQSTKEDHSVSYDDAEIKSGDDSDGTLVKSARSYSSKDLSSNSHEEEEDEKGGAKGGPEEGSLVSSGSHHSYNSAESSTEKEGFSPATSSNGVENKLVAKQDSTSSRNSVPPGSSDVENASQLDYSSCKAHSEKLSRDDPQEFSAASLRISGSSKSLLEAAEDTIEEVRSEAKHWERNARKLMLDLEILSKKYSEQSKIKVNLDMELSAACVERDYLQKEAENLKQLLEKTSELQDQTVQDNGLANVVKEMENEIRFLKETLDDLTEQLQRSQESNVELVSVLQELEETAEKRKTEIDDAGCNVDKNQELILQVQKLQKSEKNLQEKVHELKKALEGKDQTISDIEIEYQLKLSESLKEQQISAGLESSDGWDKSLIHEIDSLKAKMQELESDCQELTDENLELLLKLKKISAEDGSLISSMPEEKDHESEIHELEEKMRKIETDHCLEIQVLERKIAELNKELSEKREAVDFVSKEKEIGNIQTCQAGLEEKLCAFQDEKGELEDNVKVVTKESDITTKCPTDLQNDKTVLSSAVNTYASANKVLERKSAELVDAKRELKVRFSELKQENEELSSCISMLEAQIRNLTDDRKSIALELHNSRSNSIALQDEIARLRNQMQIQETDARQKLEEINNQWSEAREELENLRNENPKLQTTAESLIKNCSTLQNSVRQLRMHNLVLQEHSDNLEAKLRETHRNFDDCSKRVDVLQENLCSLLEESTSKEQSLTSELDSLVKENDTQNKKILALDQMHTEKSIEVENLRQELEGLNTQLCSTRDKKDRLASASAKEASDLRANIGKLQMELKATQIESKANIEDMMDELASSKQNQEMLKAEMVKMSNSLENYKSCEENFKTTINSLKLKLTVSEYENQQRTEEIAKSKAQLVKMETLEDEVVTLTDEIQKLETSLNKKSEECKELNIEKSSSIEQITELQKNVAELEDCRQDKIALEQRIEKLECSLIANKALCEQDIELRTELSWMKRSNKQLQQQIQQLEEEKQKLKTTNQSLEEEMIRIKEKQRNNKDCNSLRSPNYQNRREGDKLTDDELSKSKESRNAFKVQLKRLTSEERKSRAGALKNTKGDVGFVFERTKSSVETELRELQERYLDMSLKYAQVETEREELVMKLRRNNNRRRWF